MSTFLFSINRYKIDIQHVSGKYQHNIAADYLSRNPSSCPGANCTICKFIAELAESSVSNMNLNSTNMSESCPMGNKQSWKQLQNEDSACSEAFKRLKSGQQPAKKGQNSNDIRRYYNACQAKDMLVVENMIPNTTQSNDRIVVPKEFVPAVIIPFAQL